VFPWEAASTWKEVSVKLVLLAWLGVVCAASGMAQQVVVPLYPGTAPGSEGKTAAEAVRLTPEGEHVYSQIHHPSITVYLPKADTANGAAVLVIPGGGHKEIWIDHEGYRVADWLSQHGIAAFVLKYRLAREPGSTYTVQGTELADAETAMHLIRSRAGEWGVDPKRVGTIGFSAGGELAALLSLRAADVDRPAFEALIYPALPKVMVLTAQTPPAFLACGAKDSARISDALAGLYLRMKHAGMPVELHIFAGAGHGFGIRAGNADNIADWPELFDRWLQASGFLK
jgi:acetyl esterase/lipase